LFDFRQTAGDYQLIVLDRMEDPITPLLSQWTYQVFNLHLPCRPFEHCDQIFIVLRQWCMKCWE